jgi:CxxC motif-containing protein (DUF1111 family)
MKLMSYYLTKKITLSRWLIGLFIFFSNINDTIAAPDFSPNEAQLGGEITQQHPQRFLQPLANLSLERQSDFFLGLSFFRDPWVKAPATTTARDGLGPLFNMRSCLACHANGGRGLPPLKAGFAAHSMVFRLSLPQQMAQGDWLPDPIYGHQLQALGIDQVLSDNRTHDEQSALVRGEAKVYVDYQPLYGQYADGEVWTIYQPHYQVRDLAYGALHRDVQFSPRVAQPLLGVGLLESIAAADILQQADPHDENADGISGRVNQVWDVQQGALVPGRFGHKANQPSVLQQIAAAFRDDIGITNPLFPEENCTAVQQCDHHPNGRDPKTGVEIATKLLNAVNFFVKSQAVFAQRQAHDPQVQQGRDLFYQANCQACHRPQFTTAEQADFPELSQQTIYPYTDLLLHDMGRGLADDRPDFAANGQEWRTAPLWGIGLIKKISGYERYLHDGRARSLAEAILWHGGEAESAKQHFIQFSKNDREALLAFLRSL